MSSFFIHTFPLFTHSFTQQTQQIMWFSMRLLSLFTTFQSYFLGLTFVESSSQLNALHTTFILKYLSFWWKYYQKKKKFLSRMKDDQLECARKIFHPKQRDYSKPSCNLYVIIICLLESNCQEGFPSARARLFIQRRRIRSEHGLFAMASRHGESSYCRKSSADPRVF